MPQTALSSSSPSRDAWTEATRYLSPRMEAVNALIRTRLQSQVSLIPEVASHLILAGGKRIRPLFTLLAAQIFGYPGRRDIGLAACIEFIHTATLLHDDVVDVSTERRGQAAARLLWGNSASILVGDFLFSRAFEFMVEDGSLEVLRILSQAASTIAEGEVLQLTHAGDLALSEGLYFQIIERKTAVLFRAAAEIGAIVGEATPEQQAALRDFGQAFGLLFQLMDDWLDYAGSPGQLGKTVGDDLREAKVTLPLLWAYQMGSPEEQVQLRAVFESPNRQSPEALTWVTHLVHRTGAGARVHARAAAYETQALKALDTLPAGEATTLLAALVTTALAREH